MHPTTIHQLAMQRQAEYRQEADRQRLATLARQGARQADGDAWTHGASLASVRRAVRGLIHPLRTTGSSRA